MAAQNSNYRNAGIFLLLTALATAISVPARLAAEADLPTLEESLAAIGSAKAAYGIGGVARMVGGITLVAAAIPLRHSLRDYSPAASGIAGVLFVASGLASLASGATAVALAVTAPTDLKPPELMVLPEEELAFAIRWIAGSVGFTLAGLALVALSPVQWQMGGGVLRVAAVVAAVLGVAMLFIWLDAATTVHRITGIVFLIWLIVAGLWMVVPRLREMIIPSANTRL